MFGVAKFFVVDFERCDLLFEDGELGAVTEFLAFQVFEAGELEFEVELELLGALLRVGVFLEGFVIEGLVVGLLDLGGFSLGEFVVEFVVLVLEGVVLLAEVALFVELFLVDLTVLRLLLAVFAGLLQLLNLSLQREFF